MYQTVFPDADSRVMFTQYLINGGMPYLSNLRYAKQPSCQYLQDLYNSVVLKDTVKRNSIRDLDLLERVITFIAEKQTQKPYVQVAYLLASEETIQHEFGAYSTVRDNFPKYVVSYDQFDMSRDGLKHLHIREFLLRDREMTTRDTRGFL